MALLHAHAYGDGAPMGMPMGPPGISRAPRWEWSRRAASSRRAMVSPIFPYSAVARRDDGSNHDRPGPLPDRYGWVQRYELGVMPFSPVKDGGDRFGEWAFDLGWKYVAPLAPGADHVLVRAAIRPAAVDRSVGPPRARIRPTCRAHSTASAGISS